MITHGGVQLQLLILRHLPWAAMGFEDTAGHTTEELQAGLSAAGRTWMRRMDAAGSLW